MTTQLPQLAAEHSEVAEILASPAQHTDVAKRLCEMGYPTTEASVRRWRAKQVWSRSREVAVADLQAPALLGPSLAEQGYMLAEATRPVELPDDPVSLLAYLDQYLGGGQPDLKMKTTRDSDGITTAVITAVRDDIAEMAASLMATRIATGEGDHRCLERHGGDRATVYWWPKMRAPLFPGAPLVRYRRFGNALVRKLRTVGWELAGDRDYKMTFARNHTAKIEAAFATLFPDSPEMQAVKRRMAHDTAVYYEGL